jgi:hypothetical protein
MYASFTSDPALYFHNYFAFAFWRSLALGSYVQNAVYKGIDSVNKVLKQKGYYYYLTYGLRYDNFITTGDSTVHIIY